MNEFFAPLTEWLNGMTGFSFSIHGYIAMLLTLIGVTALYGVLLYLMRLSHTSGADDDVYEYRDPRNQSSDDDDGPRAA